LKPGGAQTVLAVFSRQRRSVEVAQKGIKAPPPLAGEGLGRGKPLPLASIVDWLGASKNPLPHEGEGQGITSDLPVYGLSRMVRGFIRRKTPHSREGEG
jgi:hypothetical protein